MSAQIISNRLLLLLLLLLKHTAHPWTLKWFATLQCTNRPPRPPPSSPRSTKGLWRADRTCRTCSAAPFYYSGLPCIALQDHTATALPRRWGKLQWTAKQLLVDVPLPVLL